MNKKLFFILIIFIVIGILIGVLIASCNRPDNNFAAINDTQIEELLKKMTLEEKVGQMTQLTLDVISVADSFRVIEPQKLDTAKLSIALKKYYVGSILNNAGHAYTKEHWFEIISQIQDVAVKQTRLGIPILYGIDAIHGANYTIGATLFPQQINQAASFNPEIVEQIASVVAYETRASSIPWTFSPVLGVGRNPLWPRIWETFGEDTYLATVLATAIVKGYEGDSVSDKTKVAACAKHYFGYSFPLSGKDRTPAWIPENFLREYFLPPFTAAFKQGAHTAMINSAEINGIPTHADYNILTNILRKEIGFKGLAVTDWEDINKLYTVHHIASSKKEAVKLAVLAGVDMSMVPYDYSFTTLLLELVKEGQISEERINESVSRILWVKKELGLFENPTTNPKDYPEFASQKSEELSKNAAIESITLLKNSENILPLSKNAKVFVSGPTANSMRCLDGGWSYTWQGEQTDEFAKDKNTILEAIQNKIGAANVSYSEGTDFNNEINISEAVAKAIKSDYVVLCLGENSYTEKPGDIEDLTLSDVQLKLAKAISATGKPIIFVLIEGRPRIIRTIADYSKAILLGYLPGNEGGNAIADVLFGDANPSGKLPYTYPRYVNSLVPYDHKYSEQSEENVPENVFNPQFEFGFGLSYSSFDYSNLKINKTEISNKDTLIISVDVKNTSERAGKEAVQLYISDLYASITPAVKRLRAFSKIELNAGELKTVVFKVTTNDLAFVGADNKWITEKGDFEIHIANQKMSFIYK